MESDIMDLLLLVADLSTQLSRQQQPDIMEIEIASPVFK
jgi:hypothetical protein